MYQYSFIIPHKNSPELLKRLVESIPERDDVQIIVVDDNSNDGKKPYGLSSKVQIIYLTAEQSNTAGHARNVGIEHALGKWLLFADADDYYSVGLLDILDKYKDSETDVVYFDYNYITANDSVCERKHSLVNIIEEYDGSQRSINRLKYHNNVPWNKMVRRLFVIENGFQYEKTVNGNDILFSLYIGYHANSYAVERSKIYNYIKTPSSLSTKKQKVSDCMCRVTHFVKLVHFLRHVTGETAEIGLFHRVGRLIRNSLRHKNYMFACELLGKFIISLPNLYFHRKDFVQLVLKSVKNG